MPYPQELKELIRTVEQTRSERVERKRKGIEVGALSLEERDERLKSYHPDYKDDSRREIRVGPSKGYAISPEIVDTLESGSRLNPDDIDLNDISYETDILIIGGGGAGGSAALVAAGAGAKVIIATKLRLGDANTIMAEGGIQAASKLKSDSPYWHYLDVIGGGHFTNDPDLVRTLVREAPSTLAWLEGLGTMFSKEPDGTLKTMHGGGTSRKRMHYAGDITGAEIMRTLRDEIHNHPDRIDILEFCPAVELILDSGGRCAGAVLYNLDTHEYIVVRAKAVILATGGSGRLHIRGYMTTNHYGATGDGLVMAYRAGVPVVFLHSVQYHPTGIIFPEQAEGLLITEKFRGAGAHLVNVDGDQFVYEREPRDVEAASIIRECSDDVGKEVPTPSGKCGVWLDSPMLEFLHGPGYVKKEFPGKYILFKRYGIDISKEPMLVYPTLHYQNGGIEFKSDASTVLEGLYTAGEVAGGVHGENRLMGNSLLDVTVFGRIAGHSATEYAMNKDMPEGLSLDHVVRYHKELKKARIDTGMHSPVILPDYTNPDVKEKQVVIAP
jgi:succinate dehydrogenase / fumarate reductase flavoprotein subunit/L-aspartate oxidase